MPVTLKKLKYSFGDQIAAMGETISEIFFRTSIIRYTVGKIQLPVGKDRHWRAALFLP